MASRSIETIANLRVSRQPIKFIVADQENNTYEDADEDGE